MNELLSGKWLIAQGALMALMGLFILLKPLLMLTLVVYAVGLYVLLDGLMLTAAGVRNRRIAGRWVPLVVRGLISIALGLLVLFFPGGTIHVTGGLLVYLLAFQAIFSGILDLRHRRGNPWGGGSALKGGVMILLGIFLLISPLFSLIFFVRLMGGLVLGAAVVALSLGGLVEAGRTPPGGWGGDSRARDAEGDVYDEKGMRRLN